MILRLAAVTAMLFTAMGSGCSQPRPKVSEEKLRLLRDSMPGMTEECLNKVKFGGIKAIPARVDQCFEMLPGRRWRGLWRDDFEGSRFCSAPARTCSAEDGGDFVWLTFKGHNRLDPAKPFHGLYAVDFIGRRTRTRGKYGHLGMSDHEIVVDRLITITPIELPPH